MTNVDKNNSDKPELTSHEETSLGYMLRLAAPMIVMTISFTLMQFIDRAMVSRLGKEALAAVLPAGMASFAPASFALGAISCLGAFVSQSFGKKKYAECAKYSWQTMYLSVLYLIAIALILWPLARAVFIIMGQPAEIIELESTYFRLMLLSQIPAGLIWSQSRFAMGIHRPAIVMYSAIIGHSVNVAANYVLIFGKFGFPKLGIAGAGVGTILGMTVLALILLGWFLTGRRATQFNSRKSYNVDIHKMRELFAVGWPAGFAFTVRVTLLGLVLFRLVGMFGTEAVAATSAVFACLNVSVMPIVGLSIALTAAVGKSIGSEMHENAVRQTRVCVLLSLVYMLIVGACFFIFKRPIMEFWSTDPNVISAGANIMIFAALFQIFDAAGVVYTGALRGAGDTLWIAFAAAFGGIVILGFGGYSLAKLFPELGAVGPWAAFSVNVIVVGLANRWRFVSNRWQQINIFRENGSNLPMPIDVVE